MNLSYLRLYILFLFIGGFSVNSQSFKVISYNIRYDNPNDGVNKWDSRKDELVDFIRNENALILGLQESLKHQIDFILEGIPDYEFIGVGREDGKENGEYAPIVFDKTKLKVIASATFWLSDTPEVVSTGWDAALPRVCTYGLFEELKTGRHFFVFNTHFDHIGENARLESAKLIAKKIDLLNRKNIPVIFMGDLNARPSDEPILFLSEKLSDGQKLSKVPFNGNQGTFSNFEDKLYDRIDYIFISNFKVSAYIHSEAKRKNGLQLSDHVPIITLLEF